MSRVKRIATVTLENGQLTVTPDTIQAFPGKVNKIIWKRAAGSDFNFTAISFEDDPSVLGHAYVHDPYITVLDYDDAALYVTYTLYGDDSGTPIKSDPKIYNRPG